MGRNNGKEMDWGIGCSVERSGMWHIGRKSDHHEESNGSGLSLAKKTRVAVLQCGQRVISTPVNWSMMSRADFWEVGGGSGFRPRSSRDFWRRSFLRFERKP